MILFGEQFDILLGTLRMVFNGFVLLKRPTSLLPSQEIRFPNSQNKFKRKHQTHLFSLLTKKINIQP